ncbi:MAG: helix-turn-helix domain-containing protein [Clostridia bacterium]|nr:helix-turn-helix domain-containing protein [Clostridia bacterium]
MSYKKIAELAGVSSATVTKVFSGSHEISEETTNRVISVAKAHIVQNMRISIEDQRTSGWLMFAKKFAFSL